MWRGEEGPARRVEDGAEAAELIAAALLVMAVITLTQKVITIVQLTILVVQVALAMAAAAPTLGGSLAEIPIAIGVARIAIRRIIKEVVQGRPRRHSAAASPREDVAAQFRPQGPGRPGARPACRVRCGRSLQGRPMLDKYRYETPGDHPGNPFRPSSVRRLSEAEREQHRVFVDSNGVMRNARDGTPFDTRAASTHWTRDGGRAIFVMDEQGNMYASNYQRVGDFHHSTLGNGQPVAAAGEIAVHDGRVQYVTSASGHYQPAPAHAAGHRRAEPQRRQGHPALRLRRPYPVELTRRKGAWMDSELEGRHQPDPVRVDVHPSARRRFRRQMAEAMVERRYFGDGPAVYADAIVQAQQYDGPLIDEIETPHSEQVFRDFLRRLAGELDQRRPWQSAS